VLQIFGQLVVTFEYCVQLLSVIGLILKRFYVRGCWDAYKVRVVLCGDGSSAEPEFQRSFTFRAGAHCKVEHCKVERCKVERCKVERCKVERCKVCSKNQVVCKLRETVYVENSV